MITAGAIVLASFFVTSSLVQLYNASTKTEKGGSLLSIQFTPKHLFECCALLLFVGNGVLWALDTTGAIDCSGAANFEFAVSTVAIVSSIAFIAAFGEYYLSTCMLNFMGSVIIFTNHVLNLNCICGSVACTLGVVNFMLICVGFAQIMVTPSQSHEPGKAKSP